MATTARVQRYATDKEVRRVSLDVVVITFVLLICFGMLLGPAAHGTKVLGVGVSSDVSLFALLAVAGALGGLVHVYGSLMLHIRRNDLRAQYLLWYRMRAFAGVPIAFVAYLAIRVGLVTQPAGSTTDVIGAAALASLFGMCAEQASAKLRDIFEALFAQSPNGGSKPEDDEVVDPEAPDPAAARVADPASDADADAAPDPASPELESLQVPPPEANGASAPAPRRRRARAAKSGGAGE